MGSLLCRLSCMRCVHAAPAPLGNAMSRPIGNQFEVPTFTYGENAQISKFRRGIRNGPKALKPTNTGDNTVQVSFQLSCGRVKLPHFFCCSGERGIPGEQN
ncbi:hypothetical protein MKX01_004051 [Papaver californicum]|nr:hypothetical protein MKX01_004051 [Papaver californicum]